MVKEFRTRKYAHEKIPGKKPDPENPEKSGSKILDIFDQILVKVHREGLIYEMKPINFEIFTKLSIF